MSKQFDSEWLRNYERRHAKNRGEPSGAKPEQTVCNDALAKAPREKGNSPRFQVVIVSLRRRLIDPDNLCGKYFVDCLRRWKVIPNDTAAIIDYSIRQERVKDKASERTEIEVTPL